MNLTTLKTFVVFLCVLCSCSFSLAQPVGFADVLVTNGFIKPVGLQVDGDGRMYTWEKSGRVFRIINGVKITPPVLDLREEVGTWTDLGLNGMVLDPNFRNNGYIYLYYNVDRHHLLHYGTPSYNPNTNQYQEATICRLTRYTLDATNDFLTVVPGSRHVLIGTSMTDGVPTLSPNHGPGSLLFGNDGSLMVCTGDAYLLPNAEYTAQAIADGMITATQDVGTWRAQLLSSANGKVLRVDPLTGDGLDSNPYYDSLAPRSARSRVWALGFRNPYSIELKPGTGSHYPEDGDPGVFYVGDVGYNTWEELIVIDSGGMNFGWPKYEGFDTLAKYLPAPENLDAPTPGGCGQSYYTFDDLLSANGVWDDPCNPGQGISPVNYDLQRYHRPKVDYKHADTVARVFVGNFLDTVGINSTAVVGDAFGGNASIAGIWYMGADFPLGYRDRYYHADFGEGWIKVFTMDSLNELTMVSDFLPIGGSVTAMAMSPTEPGLFYVDLQAGEIRKVVYSPGNLPPTARITLDTMYGPEPLTVNFSAGKSTDPDGDSLSYVWDFGDGSPTSTSAHPSHVFFAPGGLPHAYNVSLTVSDPSLASSNADQVISLNNTPPVILSTSLDTLFSYNLGPIINIPFEAQVNDAEHSPAGLTYQWQAALYHSNHHHDEPIDTNKITNYNLTPIGCDGILYFYRVDLLVEDGAGLRDSYQKDIYPNCGGPIGQTDNLLYEETVPTELDVLANDLNSLGGGQIDSSTIQIVDAPYHGTVIPDPVLGTVIYTADPGSTEDDDFTYTVEDEFGNISAPVLVSLSVTENGSSFPVEFLSFEAEFDGEKVILDWQTSREVNHAYFVIERSGDGEVFESLQHVYPEANGVYKETDLWPLTGISYYRLRQVDLDGNISYTKLEMVRIDAWNLDRLINLFPNPVHREAGFQLDFYSAEPEWIEISLIDPSGRVLYMKDIRSHEGLNVLEIPVQNWTSGMYFIQFASEDRLKTIKFLVAD